MRSKWTATTVGEEFELVNGFAFKSEDFIHNGIPVIKITNVKAAYFSDHTFSYVSPEFLDKRKDKLARIDDLLISMSGNRHDGSAETWVGKIARFDRHGQFFINQRVGALRVKDKSIVDPRYASYVLSSWDYQQLFISIATSSGGQANLSPGQILGAPFEYPPLPEQKAIAHILGSLDDKIELNRKMNATLEGMAQALFKSWFVDFDPVIDNALAAGNPIPDEFADRAEVRRQALANGTANRDLSAVASAKVEVAKHFPSNFQQTESMGWIPEGWEVKSFSTVAKLDTTSVKPFEQPDTVWEHYSIPSYDSTGMPSWERGDEIKSNKYQVKPGAILSSKLNPETERTWWPFMMDERTSICSTEFMQFVPHKKDDQAFVYSLIRSDPFQANILERVTGSTGSRQRAQPKQIAGIGVIDCGENLRAEFIKIALPLFRSIRNNSIQVQALTKLRDTLLKKLISGELRIPEGKPLTEEATA